MKKLVLLMVVCCLALSACGGRKQTKPTVSKSSKSTPATTQKSTSTQTSSNTPAANNGEPSKPGGYYLDDGPDANPPANLDQIPDAVPKKEPLLPRANKPYKALGKTYTPLSTSQDYKQRGVASWYGKRFHGKKTSSGEIYDMYSMSAAHTVLPLPSYVRVTNLANNRSVIVRINDRGPFKDTRLIDLSYAAAHKLDLIKRGSGMVEVEALHPDDWMNNNKAANSSVQTAAAPTASNSTTNTTAMTESTPPASQDNQLNTASVTDTATKVANSSSTNTAITASQNNTALEAEYYIQAGAFKNETNANTLIKKIQGLDIEQNAGINRVYNDGLHRIKVGPYSDKSLAEAVAKKMRKLLNVSTLITTQP